MAARFYRRDTIPLESRIENIFDMFNNVQHYRRDTIPVESRIENIFDMFNNVQHLYSEALRDSIVTLDYFSSPMYYNYLLIDGEILKPLLEKYATMDLTEHVITKEDHIEFRKGCFYTGKGKSERKFKHLVEVKNSKNSRSKNKRLKNQKPSEKYKKIRKIWRRGHGIAVIQLFPEVCEYEALSREFAMVIGLGLENLKNTINSTCYGVMKESWNLNQITNFGNMMVYRTLKMALQDPPTLFYENDIKEIKKRKETAGPKFIIKTCTTLFEPALVSL